MRSVIALLLMCCVPSVLSSQKPPSRFTNEAVVCSGMMLKPGSRTTKVLEHVWRADHSRRSWLSVHHERRSNGPRHDRRVRAFALQRLAEEIVLGTHT